jgi:hypothetical protein
VAIVLFYAMQQGATEPVVAIGQHGVGDVLGGPHACTMQAAEGDGLAPDTAGFHHAPACGFQGRVDQVGAGFGLVHGLVRAYSAA